MVEGGGREGVVERGEGRGRYRGGERGRDDKGRKEDFTLPHRFHVESMWSPGQSLESMWTLDIFFWW